MDNLHIIVQTYPAHFLQTRLCLESLTRVVPQKRSLTLIVDDLSNQCWPGYLDDCRQYYQDFCNEIITTGTFDGAPLLQKNPWIRQQTVKLHLDLVVDHDQWLFVDGDVQLNHSFPLEKTPATRARYQGVDPSFRDPGPGEITAQMINYIRKMLGVEFMGFWDDIDQNTIITASNPPVHVMESRILSGLRSHIIKRFNRDLWHLHAGLAADTRYAVCEWDLIEAYRRLVLSENKEWFFNSDFYSTTWQSDRELGQQWFADHGLEVGSKIWDQLPMVKYL